MNWRRFLVNSWFWTFAALSAFYNVAEAISPTPGVAFFLVPCAFTASLIAPFIWLTRLIWEGHLRPIPRINEHNVNGIPWWEDYSRTHHWVHLYDTNGFYVDNPELNVHTRVIQCKKCAQTRRVWNGCNIGDIRYGCAKIPWLWQVTHPVIPAWDVNFRPPWIS